GLQRRGRRRRKNARQRLGRGNAEGERRRRIDRVARVVMNLKPPGNHHFDRSSLLSLRERTNDLAAHRDPELRLSVDARELELCGSYVVIDCQSRLACVASFIKSDSAEAIG